MIEIKDIVDRDSLKQWLTDWPASQGLDKVATRQIVVTIAHRAAMRVMPLLWRDTLAEEAPKRDISVLPVLRVLLTSGVAANIPTSEVKDTITVALDNVIFVADKHAKISPATSAAANAALAFTHVNDTQIAANAAAAVNNVNIDGFAAKAWASVRADCAKLSGGGDVFVDPLWSDDQNPIFRLWTEIRSVANGPEWKFWITWYDDALVGRLPIWPMLEEIALIEAEVWDAGEKAVAERIAVITDSVAGMPEKVLARAVEAAVKAKSAESAANRFASLAEVAADRAQMQLSSLQQEYHKLQNTAETLKADHGKLQSEALQAARTLTDFKVNLERLQEEASTRIKAMEDAFSEKTRFGGAREALAP